jgi:hypothetical protein
MKSRVKGDFHARFCGKAEVRFLCLTRLVFMHKGTANLKVIAEK